MKTMLKLIMAICLAGTLGISGCQKDPGPKGEKGDSGPQGNANVQSVPFFASTWAWDATNLYDFCTISAPNITSSIVSSGAVLVYMQTSSGSWVQWPRTITINSSLTQSQRFAFTNNSLTLIIQDSDLTTAGSSSLTFRLVTIAGKLKAGVDYANYDEVMRAYSTTD